MTSIKTPTNLPINPPTKLFLSKEDFKAQRTLKFTLRLNEIDSTLSSLPSRTRDNSIKERKLSLEKEKCQILRQLHPIVYALMLKAGNGPIQVAAYFTSKDLAKIHEGTFEDSDSGIISYYSTQSKPSAYVSDDDIMELDEIPSWIPY